MHLSPELIDATPGLSSAPVVQPHVHDVRFAALAQQMVNFTAKRFADMVLVSGQRVEDAKQRFRPSGASVPGGLTTPNLASTRAQELAGQFQLDQIELKVDEAGRRVDVKWSHPLLGDLRAAAVAPVGYGSIVLGNDELQFVPEPIPRRPGRSAWASHDAPADSTWSRDGSPVRDAADALLLAAPGMYGVLVASPDALLLERYGPLGGPDVAMPSWSMTKSMTASLIGRLLHLGWLDDVHAPAPAPLWRNTNDVHRLITIDHLLRMRSGLGFPMLTDSGSRIGFENNFVYNTSDDVFATAQSATVVTVPGSVYRYINTGPNVLGAIIRDQIEKRGLPYRETVYQLLADPLGMAGYQHSADRFGNLVASGSGLGRLRDYAQLGLLYLQDGCWHGERLLHEGWVDYAITPTHTGSPYAAGFRTNSSNTFPSLPRDTAWASGALNQRVFMLKRQRLVIAMTNEYGHPVDAAALHRFLKSVVDMATTSL